MESESRSERSKRMARIKDYFAANPSILKPLVYGQDRGETEDELSYHARIANQVVEVETDQLRTELAEARKQIEHRERVLRDDLERIGTMIDKVEHEISDIVECDNCNAHRSAKRIATMLDHAYNALTSSGLDTPDGKEQDNDKNT